MDCGIWPVRLLKLKSLCHETEILLEKMLQLKFCERKATATDICTIAYNEILTIRSIPLD